MKRESSPSIEAAIKEAEITLFANGKGVTSLQSRTIPRFSLYFIAEARCMKRNSSDNEVFSHLKKIVSLTLDEVGEQVLAEQVNSLTTPDQLATILRDAFDMHQPAARLKDLRLLCNKLGT